MLNDVTPLAADCGRLCGAVCCTEWERAVGMYLLPGEEVMFDGNEDWLTWQKHTPEEYDLCPAWKEPVHFVICRGVCPRERRPFACRTFPVTPYLTPEGKLEMRLDDAAVPVCPLVRGGDINLLERRFLARARLAWEELLEDPRIRSHVEWESRNKDMSAAEPWRRLLK